MKIKHLLFDLDNTLYPASSAMDAGITRRMMECVAEFFNCDMDTAIELRKKNIVNHSTTLEWLRSEGLTDVEKFLAHVHPDNEADELMPQPGLREFLISLPYPKSILTNSIHEHADRVLAKLGIADLFEAVTDVRDADFCGKPYWQSYKAALNKTGAEFKTTLFLDDMIKYTDGWAVRGGTAILVGDKNGRPLTSKAKSMQDAPEVCQGRTIRLQNIYDLPELIKKLEAE